MSYSTSSGFAFATDEHNLNLQLHRRLYCKAFIKTHDQCCSIAALHAKSFGGSTYVQPVTGSVLQRLDAASQGIIAMHSTSKCNTAVLD